MYRKKILSKNILFHGISIIFCILFVNLWRVKAEVYCRYSSCFRQSYFIIYEINHYKPAIALYIIIAHRLYRIAALF